MSDLGGRLALWEGYNAADHSLAFKIELIREGDAVYRVFTDASGAFHAEFPPGGIALSGGRTLYGFKLEPLIYDPPARTDAPMAAEGADPPRIDCHVRVVAGRLLRADEPAGLCHVCDQPLCLHAKTTSGLMPSGHAFAIYDSP